MYPHEVTDDYGALSVGVSTYLVIFGLVLLLLVIAFIRESAANARHNRETQRQMIEALGQMAALRVASGEGPHGPAVQESHAVGVPVLGGGGKGPLPPEGPMDRLVKKTKDALRRLVPPGRPEQWISYVGDLQSLLNRMPHKALGGLSPQQVAMGGAQPFLPHLFAGKQWDSNSQTWWDILEALRFLRTITEIAGEVSEVKQKIAYDAAVMHHAPYKVGDWCLVYHNERASSLDSFFRGPYLITDVQVDVRGDPSGFYSVAPLLANDTLSKDVLEVHAARLWPFNGERTSSCAEHWKRLPEGFGVVQDILNHRLHARGAQVLVRYYMVPRPTWEFTSSMREPHLGWNSIYKAYCETHGLPLEGGPQWHNAREDHNGSA